MSADSAMVVPIPHSPFPNLEPRGGSGVGTELLDRAEALELAARSLSRSPRTAVERGRRAAEAAAGLARELGLSSIEELASALTEDRGDALREGLLELAGDLRRAARSRASRVRTVLVVVEDRALGQVCSAALDRADRNVVVARDRSEVEPWLRRRAAALAVLDLDLGGGADLLGELRTRGAPVVALSSADDAVARAESLALGADAYLAKPFDALVLCAQVSALLRPRP